MEKNYYEILEVDKNASKEIIDKAYKTLAKRYHPDLQTQEGKEQKEEMMKKVNEAYDVLSDENKRTAYNQQLASQNVSMDEYQKILLENELLKQQLETARQNIQNNRVYQQNTHSNEQRNTTPNVGQQTNFTANQPYQNPYVQTRRQYRTRRRLTFKQLIKIIGVIVGVILLCALIYQIPPVKEYFNNMYEENIFFKALVNIFKDTFFTKF